MRKLVVLCLLFVLLPMASAICVIPSENLEIKQAAVFCSGTYNLENGIKIVNDNLIVDCNNFILTGNGIGYGILLKDRQNVVVKNCNISNYEIGIYLDNSSNNILKNNYLTRNKFGIALQDSAANDIDDNNFSDNIQDKMIVNISLQKEKMEEPIPSKKVITNNAGSENYLPYETAKYHGNKKLGYYVIYLAVFAAVAAAFYSLYYRFYYERRKLK